MSSCKAQKESSCLHSDRVKQWLGLSPLEAERSQEGRSGRTLVSADLACQSYIYTDIFFMCGVTTIKSVCKCKNNIISILFVPKLLFCSQRKEERKEHSKGERNEREIVSYVCQLRVSIWTPLV